MSPHAASRAWRLACMMLAWVIWMMLAALSMPGRAAQGQPLPVPPLQARVTDQTGTLTTAQAEALSRKLAAIEQAQGSQVVVLIVPTTQPEDIAAYAWRVASQWKIGRRDVGDGVLLLVAKDDRAVRIEVAKALEGAIPDLAAYRIIDQVITPAFRAGDFAGGLSGAVDHIQARIQGEDLPEPSRHALDQRGQGTSWDDLGVFLFVGVPVAGAVLTSLLGRKLGSLATGIAAGALAWWWTTSVLLAGLAVAAAVVLVGVMGVGSGRRSGGIHGGYGGWGGARGGWGSGGGGGFSSGGGGDFGGGGASCRW